VAAKGSMDSNWLPSKMQKALGGVIGARTARVSVRLIFRSAHFQLKEVPFRVRAVRAVNWFVCTYARPY